MLPNTFATADAFLTFLFGGRATFTITAKDSGQHFTFDINKGKQGDGAFFANVRNGEGGLKLGMIKRSDLKAGVIKTRLSEVHPTAPSARALSWLLKVLAEGRLPKAADVQHAGRCGVCRRELTAPESISSGIGPECGGRVGLARTRKGAKIACEEVAA